MKTPAGKECPYFFGDYHRGKNFEECRLLKDENLRWQSYLCQKCPIPGIIQANSCENMKFSPQLKSPLIFMKDQVVINTFCIKNKQEVEQPKIGCGQCHPLLDIFVVGPNDNNTPD